MMEKALSIGVRCVTGGVRDASGQVVGPISITAG
jgi:hypothetical protein